MLQEIIAGTFIGDLAINEQNVTCGQRIGKFNLKLCNCICKNCDESLILLNCALEYKAVRCSDSPAMAAKCRVANPSTCMFAKNEVARGYIKATMEGRLGACCTNRFCS